MKLPIYRISIDDEFSDGEDLGINAIAFTANPAIKTKGLAFSSDEKIEKKQYYADKVKNRIAAPIMIPMDIYRCDEYEEYYVQFTESEIERMYSKFMKNFTNRQVFNLEHDNEDKVNAYVLEAWIVENPERDKAFSTYGIKVPKGTIMMVAQVADKQTYDNLVANEQTGFSIEGFLGLSLSEIINKKIQKEQQMNEEKFEMKLPAGEFEMGGKTYIVDENGVITEKVKEEAMADEPKKEDEEVKKEELADEEVKKEDEKPLDETKEEVKDEELAEEATPGDFYSKAEVDAKFEELMQIIAELKAGEIEEEIKEELPAKFSEVKTNAFELFSRSTNKNKYY